MSQGTNAGGPIVRMGGAAAQVWESSRTVTEGEPGRRQRDHGWTSPLRGEEDVDDWDAVGDEPHWMEDSGLAGMGYKYSNTRVIPILKSSYQRPGAASAARSNASDSDMMSRSRSRPVIFARLVTVDICEFKVVPCATVPPFLLQAVVPSQSARRRV